MILGLPVQDPDSLVRGMGPNPAPDPDPLVRGTDPGIRIRIRTKMSWIPSTAVSSYKPYPRKNHFISFYLEE
jgi:hypothetical protein